MDVTTLLFGTGLGLLAAALFRALGAVAGSATSTQTQAPFGWETERLPRFGGAKSGQRDLPKEIDDLEEPSTPLDPPAIAGRPAADSTPAVTPERRDALGIARGLLERLPFRTVAGRSPPGISLRELAGTVQSPPARVRPILRRLEAVGLVEVAGPSRWAGSASYRLTPQGETLRTIRGAIPGRGPSTPVAMGE